LQHHKNHDRFGVVFPAALIVSAVFVTLGLLIDGPRPALRGLLDIVTRPDLLITDYVQTSGLGAALLNVGLVTAAAATVLKLSRDPFNGYSVVTIGMMMGFSFFGKNILTIWPFIAGSWLYAKVTRRPFADYAAVSLLSTSLSPLVSYLAMGSGSPSLLLGLAVGLVIGFVMPAICPYTYRIQNGMNLYNAGFAAGLLAMMIVPILKASGHNLQTVLHWSEGYDLWLFGLIAAISVCLILSGLFLGKQTAYQTLKEYWQLLGTTGRTPSDYFRMFGSSTALFNMGINGLYCLAFLAVIGGDLNGPTAGAIITVIGFSAYGKHLRNMLPVMLGVVLGGLVLNFSVRDPALQIAVFFVTALSPIAGHFGWPFGIVAGFLHSALVLQTSGPVSGLNLYNNGFSAGLIAIIMVPVAAAIFNHHLPKIRDASFFETLEDDDIEEEDWDTAETEYLHPLHHEETDAHAFEHEPEHIHVESKSVLVGDSAENTGE